MALLGLGKVNIFKRSVMKKIALWHLGEFKHRVQRRGIDADGNVMKPYTEKYAKRKGKSGKQVQPPNMTWTGRTLNAIQIKGVRKHMYRFRAGGEAGAILKGNAERWGRDIINGIPESEHDKLTKVMNEYLKREIRRNLKKRVKI